MIHLVASRASPHSRGLSLVQIGEWWSLKRNLHEQNLVYDGDLYSVMFHCTRYILTRGLSDDYGQ